MLMDDDIVLKPITERETVTKQFSIECLQTKSKVVILTYHNRRKEHS